MRQRQRLVDRCRWRVGGAHDAIDRDEAGVVREQAVAQAELGDRLALHVAAAQRFVVAQLLNALARPQLAQGLCVGVGRGDGQHLLPIAAGALALQHELAAGLAAPLADHGHRPATEHVGQGSQSRRFDVIDLQAVEARRDLRQHRRVDRLAQPCSLRRGELGFGDDERFALAGARDAFDQVPVDGRTDAEGEHIGLAEVLAHQLEDAVFDGDIAVGDHDHAARHVAVLRQRSDAFQRRHDLGAAAGAHLVDGGDRALDVQPRRRHRVLAQHAVAAGEQHHVEAVARTQAADQFAQQGFGGVERKTVHRARDIDHEDVLARIDLSRGDRRWRLDQGEKEVLAAIGALEQGQPARRGRTGQAVLQNEVAVVGGVAVAVVGEGDLGARAGFALHLDAVRG